MMVIALVALVALVVWFVRSSGSALAHSGPDRETPMQVLDRRLAAGKITPKEHQERAAILDTK